MSWYNTIMNSKLSMDRAGRVVLPKPIRERLQLEPGESLEIESFEDHIVLRPIRQHATYDQSISRILDVFEPIFKETACWFSIPVNRSQRLTCGKQLKRFETSEVTERWESSSEIVL